MTQKTTWKLNRYQKLKKKKKIQNKWKEVFIQNRQNFFFFFSRQQTDDICLFHCSENLMRALNLQYRKKDNPQTTKTVDEGESCYWQLKPSRIIQNRGADGGEGMSQQVGSSHILKYEMKGPRLRKNPTRKLEKAGTRMRHDGENRSELKVSIRNSWSIPCLGA